MPLAPTPSATARSAAGSSSAGPPTSGASWSANPARAVASPSDGSHGSNRGHLPPGTEHVALDAGSPPTRRPVGHPPQQDGPGHRPQSTQPALPPDPPDTRDQLPGVVLVTPRRADQPRWPAVPARGLSPADSTYVWCGYLPYAARHHHGQRRIISVDPAHRWQLAIRRQSHKSGRVRPHGVYAPRAAHA